MRFAGKRPQSRRRYRRLKCTVDCLVCGCLRVVNDGHAFEPQDWKTVYGTLGNTLAHLWVTTEENQWAVLPLDGEAFSLAGNPPRAARPPVVDNEVLSGVVLVRSHVTDDASWVLLARPESGVRVNGSPLAAGMRVVSDRDEIRVPEVGSLYFSTESPARIDEFCVADQTLFCPRCKQEIQNGTRAVKCPGCGVWHHETDELNCWTYSEVCALCAQVTDMNSGFRWTPEDL